MTTIMFLPSSSSIFFNAPNTFIFSNTTHEIMLTNTYAQKSKFKIDSLMLKLYKISLLTISLRCICLDWGRYTNCPTVWQCLAYNWLCLFTDFCCPFFIRCNCSFFGCYPAYFVQVYGENNKFSILKWWNRESNNNKFLNKFSSTVATIQIQTSSTPTISTN